VRNKASRNLDAGGRSEAEAAVGRRPKRRNASLVIPYKE
jgi:hypothetical protein